jgi:hypothetical protein
MLEWLGGDALTGMLTTIGFFMFLIIGREIRIRKDARYRL